jgi:flagellar hook-length control protein FliK
MPLQLPPFAAPAAQDAVAKDHVEGRATAQPSALTPDALRALVTAAHDAEASTAKPAAAASDGLAHPAAQPPLSASTASDATSPADAVRRGATPLNVAMRSDQESAPPAMPLVDGSGADGQSDAHDAPREDRHPSPAMAARFAAAISGAEAHASTAAHDATPIFQVPVPQSAATPQQISAAATLPSATPDVPAIASDNVDRVVQSMQVGVKSGVMEATVRLRPEYLGDVTIQLRVEGSGVTAIVRAEAPAVRQWLESQEQTIRSGLAEHGLELTRLVIDPDGQQQPQHDAQQYAEEQRRAALRRRQAMSAQQRFEIVA